MTSPADVAAGTAGGCRLCSGLTGVRLRAVVVPGGFKSVQQGIGP